MWTLIVCILQSYCSYALGEIELLFTSLSSVLQDSTPGKNVFYLSLTGSGQPTPKHHFYLPQLFLLNKAFKPNCIDLHCLYPKTKPYTQSIL